ncbi:MAG TPA: cupin domain-containing protein [Candidatus Obscuribacterales bacterium]
MNLLALSHLPQGDAEIFETLLERGPLNGLQLERIVSAGQVTAAGQWYDQAWEEWVLLLQGEAELEYDDGRRLALRTGDSLLIPAHQRHRVAQTSQDPPCIWLALHLK